MLASIPPPAQDNIIVFYRGKHTFITLKLLSRLLEIGIYRELGSSSQQEVARWDTGIRTHVFLGCEIKQGLQERFFSGPFVILGTDLVQQQLAEPAQATNRLSLSYRLHGYITGRV